MSAEPGYRGAGCDLLRRFRNMRSTQHAHSSGFRPPSASHAQAAPSASTTLPWKSAISTFRQLAYLTVSLLRA